MHSSAIHDPYADATPSHQEAVIRRKAFHHAIEQRAAALPPMQLRTRPYLPTQFGIRLETRKEWKARQLQKQMPPVDETAIAQIVAKIDPPQPDKPRVVDVQECTANYYNVPVTLIIARTRTKKSLLPRHVAMYLAYTLSVKSMPEVARRFAHRDHTTILNSIRKIEALRLRDEDLQLAIKTITEAAMARVA